MSRNISIGLAVNPIGIVEDSPPKWTAPEQNPNKTENLGESALDMDDLPPLPPLPAYLAEATTSGAQRRFSEIGDSVTSEFPNVLSERTRRPSAIRLDSTPDTIYTADTYIGTADAKDIETPIDATPRHSYPPSALVPVTRERKHIIKEWIYFAAICWSFFLEGWNDGTVGPLLPRIQSQYSVGFAVVSLLFVSNCIGFVTGAFMNVYLNEKFGFGKVVLFGSLFQVVSYAMESPQPPFPVMVIGFGFAGFGMSLQNAQGNGFVSSMTEHTAIKLNILHASYGLGAFAAPLVATYFSGVRHWSFHYLISTGIAVSNVLILGIVFKMKTQDELFESVGVTRVVDNSHSGQNLYRAIMGIRAVHFLAIFALIYIGVEVTVGGWIVTFIINERSGGPSAGYISSGFFGGLTIGRLGLIWLSRKIGEHRVIFVYAMLALGLEITIWLVPNIVENGIAVAFIGFLLGPMFPILVGHASRILPRWLRTGSIGWISGVGMSGSAVLPFVTGLLSSKFGIKSLQPFLVSMMCMMLGLWALVPKGPRRAD